MVEMRYIVPPAWYKGVYQDAKSPVNAGRSFSLVHEKKSSRAVLCIHGYAGYPGEMVRPAVDLYEKGFDVFVPRLPGMGTTGEDFMRSRRSDWLTVCVNAAEDLKKKYEEVHIVGHSMGSALAILTAAKTGIKRIVTACPAIAYDGWKPAKPFPVMLVFSFVKKRIPQPWHHQSEYVLHYENAPCDDDYLGGQYWSWVYIREVYELMKLMDEARNVLPSLNADILTISGGKDQIVGDKSSLEIMEKGRGNNKHIHLPECTHFVYYDIDKGGEEKAVEATVDWLTALS